MKRVAMPHWWKRNAEIFWQCDRGKLINDGSASPTNIVQMLTCSNATTVTAPQNTDFSFPFMFVFEPHHAIDTTQLLPQNVAENTSGPGKT